MRRRLSPVLSVFLLILALFLFYPNIDSRSSQLVFPDKKWSRLEPEQAGFDAALLSELEKKVGGAGSLVHAGHLIHAWGPHDQHTDVASVVKPVITHLTLKAHEQGLIKDLDYPVAHYKPELRQLNSRLGNKDQHITWRHMMSQTSGYGVTEWPGEAFNYCDRQMALFWDTLIHEVYKSDFNQATDSVLNQHLTGPLFCQNQPKLTNRGRLRISAQDLARIGLLYLSGGYWKGQALLDPEYVRLAVASPHPSELPRTNQLEAAMLPGQRSLGGTLNMEHHMNSYSNGWWTNGLRDDGQRVLPDAPPDTFGAFGHGGRHALVVIPSRNLVLTWVEGLENRQWFFSVDGRDQVNEVIRLALRAGESG